MPRAPIVLFLGAGASAPIGFPTTKQFGKNIGLDPYDQNLLRNNMGDRADFLKRVYQKIQVEDIEGLYNFVHSYGSTPEIELIRERFRESKNQQCINQFREYLRDISRLEGMISNILHRSYDYQPEEHDKKSSKIYAPLFDLLLKTKIMGDLNELPIFTTNYDVVIEKMFKMPFILGKYDVTDGFKLDEKSDAWIYDDLEFTRSGTNEKPIIKLYKLHGSMNWAIRKNDDVLVKNIGSTFRHVNYDSPIISYPGIHTIPLREEFKILNAHFEQVLRKAEICIVIGFSFRDYGGINQLFAQVMRNVNKKLFVEISNLSPNFQDHTDTADLFNDFTGRYEYHSGGIQKIEQKLRKKYKNISRDSRKSKR